MGEYFKSEFDCEYDAVISLESPPVGESNTLRSNGWREGFEQVCGPLQNAKTYDTDATTEGGRKVFTDVLTSLPAAERIVVFPLNDDLGLGAKAAADAQGRTDNVFIAGQGADTSVICELKSNPQWIGDTAYFPEKWGYSIVPNLIRLVNEESVEDNLYVPHVFVDSSNVDEFYDTSKC
jgi:ribose transport system substrate-binding protein